MGLTTLGLHSVRNLGLLLHLLGLRAPENEALAGLDGVLIGLRTRELLQQLLEARCRLSPVVVMLMEDLHWIDSASEELLGKIVDGQGKLRLLLLHTRRPEYAPAWLDRATVTKLQLEPLPGGHIRRLIQARLGVDVLPEALARSVLWLERPDRLDSEISQVGKVERSRGRYSRLSRWGSLRSGRRAHGNGCE
jgi:predicted ATPase